MTLSLTPNGDGGFDLAQQPDRNAAWPGLQAKFGAALSGMNQSAPTQKILNRLERSLLDQAWIAANPTATVHGGGALSGFSAISSAGHQGMADAWAMARDQAKGQIVRKANVQLAITTATNGKVIVVGAGTSKEVLWNVADGDDLGTAIVAALTVHGFQGGGKS